MALLNIHDSLGSKVYNSHWKQGRPFDVPAWLKLLDWAHCAPIKPLWVLVPDAVGDRDQTLRMWDEHAETVRRMGWPLAFAAQDGMTFDDVPTEAAVVFLGGGGDEFKASALFPWCARFRCHVGRVTALDHLWRVFQAGAISCDATGHFRTDRQRRNLEDFLARVNAGQKSLNCDDSNAETVPGFASCETAERSPAGVRN